MEKAGGIGIGRGQKSRERWWAKAYGQRQVKQNAQFLLMLPRTFHQAQSINHSCRGTPDLLVLIPWGKIRKILSIVVSPASDRKLLLILALGTFAPSLACQSGLVLNRSGRGPLALSLIWRGQLALSLICQDQLALSLIWQGPAYSQFDILRSNGMNVAEELTTRIA